MSLTLALPLTDEAEALLAPIGFTTDGQPIWPVFGAEPDDDDDDSDDEIEVDDENDDSDDEEEDDSEKEWKPPTKAEFEKMQRALKRANTAAKNRRQQLKEKGTGEDAEKKAQEAAEKKFKPVAVRSAAKAALLEAGLNDASDDRIKKLMRMIDMDDVEIDDDGDVEGLEDQIESIKEDFPALFEKKTEGGTRKRATRLDASGRNGGGGSPKKSSAERLAASALGKK